MYRKDASLMQFEQILNNLGRDEVNNLESELNRLYHEYQNPTCALAILRENDVYNIESLEQKLEIVKERKQYLNEKFKVQDQIVDAKNRSYSDNAVGQGGLFWGSISIAMFGLFEFLSSPYDSLPLFASVVTTIISIPMLTSYYIESKKTKHTLKQLKKSPEYLALQQNEEKGKLPIIETTEAKQLPSPERKAIVNTELVEDILERKILRNIKNKVT